MPSSVAIIIPCFNHGRFVGEAVASALAQTLPAKEIIIVDDASDDETRRVCASLASSKVKVIRHEMNLGLAASRNEGIRQASSEFILPLDADDRILPNFLERVLPELESSPEVGWVYTDCHVFGVRQGFLDFPDYKLALLLAHNLCLATSLFRKTDWERVGGYDISFKTGQEDWDLWISMAGLGLTGKRVSERLFEYRQHVESMRTRSYDCISKSADRLWLKHSKLYQEHMEAVWKIFLGRYYGGAPDPFRAAAKPTVGRWISAKVRRLLE